MAERDLGSTLDLARHGARKLVRLCDFAAWFCCLAEAHLRDAGVADEVRKRARAAPGRRVTCSSATEAQSMRNAFFRARLGLRLARLEPARDLFPVRRGILRSSGGATYSDSRA